MEDIVTGAYEGGESMNLENGNANSDHSQREIYRNQGEPDRSRDYMQHRIPSPVPQAPELTMEVPEESDDDEDEAEQAGFQLLRQKLVQQEAALEERSFTDKDNDPIAVKSREVFAKAQDKEAEELVEKGKSATGSELRGEGQRRTGSRFATEHDFERVLRESEREAKESKEQKEQDARETESKFQRSDYSGYVLG
ncbi:hypothetical protein DID88_002235 [Monilinia fructigena]|uniref:Uncharacterized protein n=1 Tax=Monilinia fructigena TaxID=38457 RepID=A0A395IDI5_9HELO|nr:hypothetical protein DID88_002235 [Monilinia fructigena]